MSGRRVRFRSFTLLRSPLALAHSQFTYWHHASAVPRQLFYQLSPELVFYRDTLKLINDRGPVCSDESSTTGGLFLNLPLEERGNDRVCAAGPWQVLCQQLILALVTSEEMRKQQGWFHVEEDFLRHNAHLLAAHVGNATAPLNAALWRRSCSNRDLNKTATSVAAVAPDAPYAELEAALAGMCPALRLKVLQITGCLVDRARRVEKKMLEVGCDGVIRQAFDRLDQLSHVLFMDAFKFSLEHAFEMAARGADQRDVNTSQPSKLLRTNIGITADPFIASEIEPFNRCSNRFCAYHDEPAPNAIKTDFPCPFVCADGEAFAKYTARVPHFEVLRELDLLKSPINGQVREASQDNAHVPTGQGETPVW